MTEQEEEVARQRLGVLTVFQGRLIELKTDATLIYPEGHERHDRAQKDLDDLTEIVERLDVDPMVVSLILLDAEREVTRAQESLEATEESVIGATEALAAQQVASAEAITASKEALAERQGQRDEAAGIVKESEAALTVLQGA